MDGRPTLAKVLATWHLSAGPLRCVDQPEPVQQPEPEPGEMTRDEAEQLLQWAQDSDEVNRRQAPLRVRCPSKPW